MLLATLAFDAFGSVIHYLHHRSRNHKIGGGVPSMRHAQSRGFISKFHVNPHENAWFRGSPLYEKLHWLVVTGCHEFGIFPLILGCSSSLN